MIVNHPASRTISLAGVGPHHLSVDLRHRAGALDLDVTFRLERPWTVLFAPSGAGKTTILRVIAGLLRPDEGRIAVTMNPGSEIEREFVLTDTKAGIFVPPHRRVVRMLSGDSALFPHLNVRQNVEYNMPRMARDEDERQARDAAAPEMLEFCRLIGAEHKMPSELSNGERQRAGLARALMATGCRLLLLDEPFTGLDVALRDELIADLRLRVAKRRTPVLQITHDIGEAFAADAEVILLRDGKVARQGPAAEVLGSERERLLARLR